MEKAVQAVREGLSLGKASKAFKVPKSTLSDRISQRVLPGAPIGRPPALPAKLEEELVSKVENAAAMGFGVSRRQLLVKTGRLVNKLKISTPFKDGVPGKDWFDGLRKRHPTLSIKKPLKLSVVRSRMLNSTVVDSYFETLNKVITDLNLSSKPEAIWNADETGFQMEHQPASVCARRGAKVPGRTSNSRESISTLLCVNAQGGFMPPMVVVRGKTKRCLQSWGVEDAPAGTVFTYQARAWMDDILGEEWFHKVFLANCGPHRPQLLILDSHSSHEVIGLLEAAVENDVHILALPPHTTHFLQPLDKSINGPLKAAYKSVCSEFMNASPENTVNKKSWPGLFRQSCERALTPQNITSGFRATGIHPLDRTAIPSDALAPSKVFDSASTSTSPHVQPFEQDHESSSSTCLMPSASVSTIPGLNSSAPRSSASVTFSESQLCGLSVENEMSVSSESASVPHACVGDPDPFLPVTPIADSDGQIFNLSEAVTASQILTDLAKGGVNVELVASPDISECRNELSDDLWNSQISSLFDIPSPENTNSKPVSQKRKLTSHRLLTSEDILNEKRKKAEEKREQELKKQQRKMKKERALKGKKID